MRGGVEDLRADADGGLGHDPRLLRRLNLLAGHEKRAADVVLLVEEHGPAAREKTGGQRAQHRHEPGL